jgi:SIT4-associating protein SAP185/190
MLRGGNPLTVGVGIIIEVIRKNNSDYDLENQIGPVPKNSDPIYLGTLLRQFAEHIPQFMELVHNPNHAVVNKDGSTTIRRRELKTAFGEKIEPLGFDRFKTCELMAELLHCSNMALLNERGSEAEVKRRDAERERLKAEGKLTSKTDHNSGDFSTSVDSHGFHHARAPSSEAPEVVKRLEVQNNSEDDFEKVTAIEATSEESKESEKKAGSPQHTSDTPTKDQLEKADDGDGEFVDEPLSPVKESSSEAATPKPTDDAESPTSAGLSAKVGGMDLDNDTVMGDRQDLPHAAVESVTKEVSSLLTQQLSKEGPDSSDTISPHPDDTPAPLFAGKRNAESSDDSKQAKPDVSRFTAAVAESDASEVTPIDDTSSARSVLLGGGAEGQYSAQYEVDIDGSPVVGDLLKMKFVENKVVPTILVSARYT